MIIGGQLDRHMLVLHTPSELAAQLLQNVFVGNQPCYESHIFGEKILAIQSGTHVLLKKLMETEFKYEEIRDIVNKSKSFKHIDNERADNFLNIARENLDSHHTLFFHSNKDHKCEMSIFDNWARFDFDNIYPRRFFSEFKRIIGVFFGESVKLFSNYTNELSIHSALKNGIFLNRMTFLLISEFFIANKIIQPNEQRAFIDTCTSFAIRHVAIRKAKKLQHIMQVSSVFDEFDNEEREYGSDDHATVSIISSILNKLMRRGAFSDLDDQEVQFLYQFLAAPHLMDHYSQVSSLKQIIFPIIIVYYDELKDHLSRQLGYTFNDNYKLTFSQLAYASPANV